MTDSERPELTVEPVTPERWADLEDLFGPNGAVAGCWCMWWRVTRKEFAERTTESKREALQAIVERGDVPGLLAYAEGKPVGWCSIGPREWFPGLDRSRTLARVDDEPVWSVNCFYVRRGWRRKGVTSALLDAAVAHAKRQGARLVEGYPKESGSTGDAFTGFLAQFERAGFKEVVRRSKKQPVVRLDTDELDSRRRRK